MADETRQSAATPQKALEDSVPAPQSHQAQAAPGEVAVYNPNGPLYLEGYAFPARGWAYVAEEDAKRFVTRFPDLKLVMGIPTSAQYTIPVRPEWETP